MMRIAFLVDLFPCISHTFILNQITGLIDRGCEIDIYATGREPVATIQPNVDKYNLCNRTRYFQPMPSNPTERLLRGLGLLSNSYRRSAAALKALNIFKYGRQAASLRMMFAALSWPDTPQYDILHCHFGTMGILATWLSELRLIRCPIITTFHGTDVNVLPRRYGNNYYKRLLRTVDCCTVSSDFIRQQVRSLGATEEKIAKLPVGVDTREFKFKTRHLGPGEKVNVTTVARLVPVKGIAYSIRAICKVLTRYKNVTYRIIGDGPLRGELQALTSRLGVRRHVQFLGALPQDKIRSLFDSTHIFLLSSVVGRDGAQEGQGAALLEAQAAGIPVLSTRVGGIPESVVDGKSGFLVPERDVDALAERLHYLINHPDIWPEMGRAGRKHVEEHYDINKLNDQLVEIYRRISKA